MELSDARIGIGTYSTRRVGFRRLGSPFRIWPLQPSVSRLNRAASVGGLVIEIELAARQAALRVSATLRRHQLRLSIALGSYTSECARSRSSSR
jgi:hypothetical protein